MARDPQTPRSENEGPRNPSTVTGTVNPSSPNEGTVEPSTNLAGNNPTAFKPSREGAGDLRSTPSARDSREMTFRCADVGRENCNWEVRAQSEQEMMQQIERHGREQHNINSFDENSRNRILNAIRRRSAA
jgi:predicted small metal-binding protein